MRIAPREVLLVGPADPHAVRDALDEPGAIVDDVSDGWAAFELAGDDARDVVRSACPSSSFPSRDGCRARSREPQPR